jgi:hypothetical protein
MGTLITSKEFQQFLPSTFVFDLEYVGVPNNLNRCYIWEIGIIHLISGTKFSITMDPEIRPLPPPMSEEFANVTEEFLKNKNAVGFNFGWNMFLQFVRQWSENRVLLISHNNFKSDKLMLEIEAKRRGLELPYKWYFLDSLLYCRKVIPKQPSYTLHDLYYGMFGKRITDNHSALPDAIALVEILYRTNIVNICGPIYPSFCTSLQAIKWLGPSCERALFENNIRSLEQLVANIIAGYSGYTLIKSGPTHMSEYVNYYITTICGITTGNSTSISHSIVEKWLPSRLRQTVV